ncbi:MAG: class I SAM-dependent methyltransferase [Chloroflexia bacterium]
MNENPWPPEGLERVERCPICGNQARSVLHQGLDDQVFFCAPGVWTQYRCRVCGSAYLDPRPTRESIHLAYSSYYTHSAPTMTALPAVLSRRFRMALGYLNVRYNCAFKEADRLGYLLALLTPLRGARQDRSVRHLRRPAGSARLLDVGCGNGEFLAWMRLAGWEVEGIDPDPQAVASARSAGLSVQEGTLAEVPFPEGSFEAITLSHVIEHLHDPSDALRACFHALKPGGTLWIATPNLAAQGHREFGKRWLHLDPPRHLILFTPRSLRALLRPEGFQVAARPKPSYSTEWTYQASAAIANGHDPINSPPPLPAPLKRKARLAEWRAYLRPQVAEEIVLLARKPL